MQFIYKINTKNVTTGEHFCDLSTATTVIFELPAVVARVDSIIAHRFLKLLLLIVCQLIIIDKQQLQHLFSLKLL